MFYAKTKYIDYIEGIAINSIVILLYSQYIFCLDTKRVLHYENTPIQIYCKFYHQKMKIFR